MKRFAYALMSLHQEKNHKKDNTNWRIFKVAYELIKTKSTKVYG